MWIGHRKEIGKLTFRALALRWSESESNRSDEGLTLETSASQSLYGGQFTLSTQLIKPNYTENQAFSCSPSYEVNAIKLVEIKLTLSKHLHYNLHLQKERGVLQGDIPAILKQKKGEMKTPNIHA